MENIALQGPHTYDLYVHYIVLVWRQQNFAIYGDELFFLNLASECGKCSLRDSRIQKIAGGPCPRTPLGGSRL
jgi:hypothetical protein